MIGLWGLLEWLCSIVVVILWNSSKNELIKWIQTEGKTVG